MSRRETQHPQIEGDVDQRVFGTAEARARPYLPVVAADGSVWAVALVGEPAKNVTLIGEGPDGKTLRGS